MKQAVVLAAGKGERMLPLTEGLPKPLIKINDKPFITYLLDNLEKAGYEKVFLVVEYLKDKMKEYFANHSYSFDFQFIDQGEPMGTGHAVLVAKDYVEGEFAVINGDDIYPLNDLKNIPFGDNYNYIYAFKHENPKNFGVIVYEGEFLVDLEEKPENPKSNLVNSGLYKFTPEIFDALSKIHKSKRGEYELTSAIYLLAKEKRVKVKEVEFWQPFGKLEDIPIVEKLVKEKF
ncbi:sugar phosphate nucleotidyltransferase [Bacteroidota bacterium]